MGLQSGAGIAENSGVDRPENLSVAQGAAPPSNRRRSQPRSVEGRTGCLPRACTPNTFCVGEGPRCRLKHGSGTELRTSAYPAWLGRVATADVRRARSGSWKACRHIMDVQQKWPLEPNRPEDMSGYSGKSRCLGPHTTTLKVKSRDSLVQAAPVWRHVALAFWSRA